MVIYFQRMTGSSSSEESQSAPPARPTRAPAETLVSASRNTGWILVMEYKCTMSCVCIGVLWHHCIRDVYIIHV